jgi:hypothetical protein
MMKVLTGTALLGALAGCVTVQLPSDRVGRLAATLQRAQSMGAAAVPAARHHLELAQQETALAKQAATAGDDRANMLLARAQSDAMLAEALAHEAAVHGSMERTDTTLRKTQEALEKGGTP